MECSIQGCDRQGKARQMCNTHYERWRRSGDAGASAPVRLYAAGTPAERLRRNAPEGTHDECWEWQGATNSNGGYGVMNVRGRLQYTHRIAWEAANGPIPKRDGYHGAVVMHTCDNPPCVNPAHLKLGSQGDNLRDMARKGRQWKQHS